MTKTRLTYFAALLLAFLAIQISHSYAEERAITSAKDLNCSNTYPPLASVTNLDTGLGVGKFSFDASADATPPCSGTLPNNPPFAGEAPLPAPIPQLAKIITNAGQCSGDFIAQNAVITAGHCVFDQNTKQFATNVQIIAGYQNGQSAFNQSFTGQFVLTFDAYTSSNLTSHDIAVIKFQGSLLQQYGYYGLSAYNVSNCTNASKQKQYTEPHYSPNISNNQVQAFAQGQTLGCVQGTVVTALPLLPGSSGSAVIDHYSVAVFAVHSEYSLTPPASYDAVLTHAEICTIDSFVSGSNSGTIGDCEEGN
jgi:hypothetical protein